MPKNRKKIKKLKRRIKALESIVCENSITFTDPAHPNKQIVMKYENGAFTVNEVTTGITVSSQLISTLNQ